MVVSQRRPWKNSGFCRRNCWHRHSDWLDCTHQHPASLAKKYGTSSKWTVTSDLLVLRFLPSCCFALVCFHASVSVTVCTIFCASLQFLPRYWPSLWAPYSCFFQCLCQKLASSLDRTCQALQFRFMFSHLKIFEACSNNPIRLDKTHVIMSSHFQQDFVFKKNRSASWARTC